MSAGSQIWEQPTLAQVHLQPSSVCDTQHRLLWHIPTQAFCSITEICITERKRARSSGKYYITLLLKCCPYLGTLLLQSLPLKGNKAEGRRMRTVWRPPFAPVRLTWSTHQMRNRQGPGVHMRFLAKCCCFCYFISVRKKKSTTWHMLSF